jgi:hypothetical protein
MFICIMSTLFSLFRLKQLKPVWEFSPGALVWKILFTSRNTIVGEAREQSSKSTKYFCIDSFSGKVLWKEKEYNEPWWIGIETVYDKWIILHGFARPDMPEHRGIRIVDLDTGALLWRNDDVTYWFIYDQKLYAYKYLFEKRIGYKIDMKTGALLHEYSENVDELHELRKLAQQSHTDLQTDLLFPELFTETKNDPRIDGLVRRIIKINALEDSIEVLVQNNILFVSYYQREEKSQDSALRNIFTVYDVREGRTLFTEVLLQHVQVPSPDAFFVKDKFVYFIKNQNTVTALQPWKY